MSEGSAAPAVRVRVNGEERVVPSSTTVTNLLEELGLPMSRVAVEFNLEILPKPSYSDTLLREDDRLEIVQFVGGG